MAFRKVEKNQVSLPCHEPWVVHKQQTHTYLLDGPKVGAVSSGQPGVKICVRSGVSIVRSRAARGVGSITASIGEADNLLSVDLNAFSHHPAGTLFLLKRLGQFLKYLPQGTCNNNPLIRYVYEQQ